MPGERAQVHSRLAASLQSRRPDRMGEIARHWSAANDASPGAGCLRGRRPPSTCRRCHRRGRGSPGPGARAAGHRRPGRRRGSASITPPCFSRRPSPRSTPATSIGRSSSISERRLSWPASTGCARPRYGCTWAICTASRAATTRAPTRPAGRSPSSRSHRRHATGSRPSPMPARRSRRPSHRRRTGPRSSSRRRRRRRRRARRRREGP